MNRIIALGLALLLGAGVLYADTIMIRRAAAGGGSGTLIWDDFDRTDEDPITGWADAKCDWEIEGNQAEVTGLDTSSTSCSADNDKALATSTTALDSDDHWVCAYVHTEAYRGLAFRGASTADGDSYAFRIQNNSLHVRDCPGGIQNCNTFWNASGTVAGSQYEYWCVEVTGENAVGGDTEIKVWQFSDVTTPPARASWDSTADETWCWCESANRPCSMGTCTNTVSSGSPGTFIDTGKYVSLYDGWTANQSSENLWDDFCASDTSTDTTGCTGY